MATMFISQDIITSQNVAITSQDVITIGNHSSIVGGNDTVNGMMAISGTGNGDGFVAKSL